MDVSSLGPNSAEADQHPLLMEQENHSDREHIIDIRNNDSGSSLSPPLDEQSPPSHLPQHRVSSSSTEAPSHQSSSFSQQGPSSRNFSSTRRREDAHGRRSNRSPLNSGLWISVELAVTVAQIIAAIVVLSLAKDEHPHAPLFAWIVGYASGCVATLPILYWRFRTYNHGTDQNAEQSQGGFSRSNNPPESMSYTAVSVVQAPVEGNHPGIGASSRESRVGENLSLRANGRVDHFKMALDCFFAVWFVVGNVWIFRGPSSSSDAPKLYRLCIVFLTFSCIGYAMPFILCATICCCLPCLVSLLGIRENLSQTRGATVESINALPIYKFMSKSVNDQNDLETVEGGFLLSGSEKKRLISGEDAVCCICLAKYADDDELRELTCSHVFHVDCVDKWLKINASCPLCKSEVGECSSPAAP